jgi:hypothetical protein
MMLPLSTPYVNYLFPAIASPDLDGMSTIPGSFQDMWSFVESPFNSYTIIS